MRSNENTLRCHGCGIEIRWRPLIVGNFTFCCNDCLHGHSCECQDSLEIEDERRESKSAVSLGIEYSPR